MIVNFFKVNKCCFYVKKELGFIFWFLFYCLILFQMKLVCNVCVFVVGWWGRYSCQGCFICFCLFDGFNWFDQSLGEDFISGFDWDDFQVFFDVVWDFFEIFFIFFGNEYCFYVIMQGCEQFFFQFIDWQDLVMQGNFVGYGDIFMNWNIGQYGNDCCYYVDICRWIIFGCCFFWYVYVDICCLENCWFDFDRGCVGLYKGICCRDGFFYYIV